MQPYTDIHFWNNLRIRTFSSSKEEELIWHKDKKDRLCVVLYGKGWSYQLDNQLPISLSTGDNFIIQKETYHRLIRDVDSTGLLLIIKEFEDEYTNENCEHTNEVHDKTNSQICSV